MTQSSHPTPDPRAVRAALLRARRSLVLVGLMGAGKTTVGRRLSERLALPFADADEAIEDAARLSVAEIFAQFGEAEFRAGERRVIRRLLSAEPIVLATGGGAFVNAQTRSLIRATAVSVWLQIDLDTLAARTARRDHRPLLRGRDHREVLGQLLQERAPAYGEADLVIAGGEDSVEAMTDRVLAALASWLECLSPGPATGGTPTPTAQTGSVSPAAGPA